MQKLERIQKYLASYGVGSRREIEQWIAEGRLRVNGKIAFLGQKVFGTEKFLLDNQPIKINTGANIKTRVLLYHKPVGEITTRKDPYNRVDVFGALPRLANGRWISVGRLDINTAGLLLFTNDGQLANKLMHPKNEFEREYWVRVAGDLDQNNLQALRNGVLLDEQLAKFDQINMLKASQEEDPYNRYYSVVLREGRNREVRRLFEAVGCRVSRLKRVRFGNLVLPKYLRAGSYQELDAAQIKSLLKSSAIEKAKSNNTKRL